MMFAGRLRLLMTPEPATGDELGEDAGRKQDQADGKGADDPVEFHSSLKHEPVEQGQDQDQNGCLGKERGAAMCGDGDQIEGWGGMVLGDDSAA